MNQAVIETGGKQYLVSPNDKVIIEKLEAASAMTGESVRQLIAGAERMERVR